MLEYMEYAPGRAGRANIPIGAKPLSHIIF